LTLEEDEMEKSLRMGCDTKLVVPSDFETDIALELANLTRIAYKDYELFSGDSLVSLEQKDWGVKITQREKSTEDDQRKKPKPSEQDRLTMNLHKDTFLCVDSKISSTRINEYFIAQNEELSESSDSFLKNYYADGFIRYRVLAVYNYLAYSFPDNNLKNPFTKAIPIPDVDRFGFIVERVGKDNEKYVFVIFRGTREGEEWFVNLQFKQQNCLMTKEGDAEPTRPLQTSLGFNKIYTDYRPGILQGEKQLNSLSRYFDEKIRLKSKARYPDEHALHKESIHDTIDKSIRNTFKISDEQHKRPRRIFISGHSLGAALATIAGLHISRILEEIGQREKVKIISYTYASPRVGNSEFAKECNMRFMTYRIANSEDVVPGVPPAVFRFIGEEMIPSSYYNKARSLVAWLTGGLTKDIYEHVGYPIVFTSQVGAISSNHNMNATYFHALNKLKH
jgi:hypothetical protein